MEIEKIRVARWEMEDVIQAAVAGAVYDFYIKTGMYPRSIDIMLVEVTAMGDREKRYEVGDVRADVPI